jgi:hypothetical protein
LLAAVNPLGETKTIGCPFAFGPHCYVNSRSGRASLVRGIDKARFIVAYEDRRIVNGILTYGVAVWRHFPQLAIGVRPNDVVDPTAIERE